MRDSQFGLTAVGGAPHFQVASKVIVRPAHNGEQGETLR